MNKIAKALKWGASALRVAKMCVVAGNWLKIASGKPLYLGKGARVILGEGATLVLEGGVYMNEGCRVTAVVKRGSSIACRPLVSENPVVTCDLTESGALYAGAPARLV